MTTTPACPICRKPREIAFRPFCSKRCADVDLSRWLNGVYMVAEPHEDGQEKAVPTQAEDAER